MIVRTYGRRNRGIARTFSDTRANDDVYDAYSDSFSLSQEKESPEELYNFSFSSQDSTRWTFNTDAHLSNPSESSLQFLAPIVESENEGKKSKKLRKNEKWERDDDWERMREGKMMAVEPQRGVVTTTATLMETQECGEMMEHMDEINFALDGLRKGQPVRIRRASLLSLLAICETSQQRRLLRAQGTAKTIIDALYGLNLDDSPSNLAAAVLFYLLTDDGLDDYLLDSPSSVSFLLRLLKQSTSIVPEEKAPAIGHKLLSLRKVAHMGSSKRLDSSSTAIIDKVKEALKHCEEMKTSYADDEIGISRPELSSRWIALLIMEKGSFTTISMEDTLVTIRKHDGDNFKERLREMDGLDAVFELAMSLHSNMEGWLECVSAPTRDSKEDEHLESLVLLLRCLKIMENAAFGSKENQCHLLGMRQTPGSQSSPDSFTKLMISFIEILSGLYLQRGSSVISSAEMAKETHSGTSYGDIIGKECSSSGRVSPQMGSDIPESSKGSSSSRFGSLPYGGTTSRSKADSSLVKTRLNSLASGSSSMTSSSSDGGTLMSNNGSDVKLNLAKKSCSTTSPNFENLVDNEDPFAFDEDEFQLSRWDAMSGKPKLPQKPECRVTTSDLADGCLSQPTLSQEEFVCEASNQSSQTSCSSAVSEESFVLLSDCLLTAVKVLMNLTNDNTVGCQQIAACGGLETLSCLIAYHFPLFNLSISSTMDTKAVDSISDSVVELESQTDTHLSDREMEFLVAILGLLVNMVEKDEDNRSRLATASVSLPCSEAPETKKQRGVIPLLCSIFLANQGAGEAAEDGSIQPCDAEQVVLEGEKEAGKMIVEAYSALVLAFLSTESKNTREMISGYLPDNSLEVLIPVLERFMAFHLALEVISKDTHKAVSEVIESLREI